MQNCHGRADEKVKETVVVGGGRADVVGKVYEKQRRDKGHQGWKCGKGKEGRKFYKEQKIKEKQSTGGRGGGSWLPRINEKAGSASASRGGEQDERLTT